MRLLIDMNLTPQWVGYLAETGHDAVHWSEVGPIDVPDEQLMVWAAGEGRILLTQDLDFGLLLRRSGGTQPSVVQIRAQGTLPTDIGSAVCMPWRLPRATWKAVPWSPSNRDAPESGCYRWN